MSTMPMPPIGGMMPPPVSGPVHGIPYFPQDLPYDDGEPMESPWHRMQMTLLIECVEHHRRDRDDYFAGGNMFVYFSPSQVRNRDYRGPDFFLVNETSRTKPRNAWVVWDEDSRCPDLVVELMSPPTRDEDLGTKFKVYETILRTPEYVAYDPATREIKAWRLGKRAYEPIQPDGRGWIWLEQAGLWLGKQSGEYLRTKGIWLRFYEANGSLVPTKDEIGIRETALKEQEKSLKEQERARADKEAARADLETTLKEQAISRANALEAELAKLKAERANDA